MGILRDRVRHPHKLKGLKCSLGELGDPIMNVDKLDLVVKNIEDRRLAANNLCKLGKLNHGSALGTEMLKLLGLRSLTGQVLHTLRGFSISIDDNLRLTITAIAKVLWKWKTGSSERMEFRFQMEKGGMLMS